MNNSPFINARDLQKGFDFGPWGGIEGFLRASKTSGTGNFSALVRMVPDLAKAVDMTATAVAGMPFDFLEENGDVFDTSGDWQNSLGGIPDPKRLVYLLAASLCGGAAYVIPFRTPRMIVDLQYAAPHTVTPYIDINGLQYFNRSTDTGKTDNYIKPAEILYFWLPDKDVEIGPALNNPIANAAQDAQAVWSLKNTIKIYGERGFVPITLLGAKGMPNEAERKKAEGFFDRLLRGGFDVLAKIFNADSLTIQRLGAGMEELKQSYKELRSDAKTSIADSFGIPTALFMADQAYASEFNALRRQWYTSGRLVSIYQTIEEVMTEQLLKAYKKRMRFNPQAMEVFQEHEANTASALSTFVSAVSSDPRATKLGMGILHYDLTDEQAEELDALIKDKEKEPEPVPPPMLNAAPVEEPLEGQEADIADNPPEEEKALKANENSAMIALRIPDLIKAEIQSRYPFMDKELLQDLHITLVYLGDSRTMDKLSVIRAVSDLGMFQSPIKGRLQGLARFVSGGETDPIVMTFDSPQAPKLYNTLCSLLDNYHVPYHKDYGFIPHMTLAYIPRDSDLPIETIEPVEINFFEVYYVEGSVWFPVGLTGYENKTTPSTGLSLSADDIKDLALWLSKAKTWLSQGKGGAVDWENKHLSETIAAPIRLKLAQAKTEADITAAFDFTETTTPVQEYQTVDQQALLIMDGLRKAIEKA